MPLSEWLEALEEVPLDALNLGGLSGATPNVNMLARLVRLEA